MGRSYNHCDMRVAIASQVSGRKGLYQQEKSFLESINYWINVANEDGLTSLETEVCELFQYVVQPLHKDGWGSWYMSDLYFNRIKEFLSSYGIVIEATEEEQDEPSHWDIQYIDRNRKEYIIPEQLNGNILGVLKANNYCDSEEVEKEKQRLGKDIISIIPREQPVFVTEIKLSWNRE